MRVDSSGAHSFGGYYFNLSRTAYHPGGKWTGIVTFDVADDVFGLDIVLPVPKYDRALLVKHARASALRLGIKLHQDDDDN